MLTVNFTSSQFKGLQLINYTKNSSGSFAETWWDLTFQDSCAHLLSFDFWIAVVWTKSILLSSPQHIGCAERESPWLSIYLRLLACSAGFYRGADLTVWVARQAISWQVIIDLLDLSYCKVVGKVSVRPWSVGFASLTLGWGTEAPTIGTVFNHKFTFILLSYADCL